MVYELTCNESTSIYVGQTCQHITTRVAELANADSPVRIHGIKSNGGKTAFQWKIVDQCGNQSKLMTQEALYIGTQEPAINSRDK